MNDEQKREAVEKVVEWSNATSLIAEIALKISNYDIPKAIDQVLENNQFLQEETKKYNVKSEEKPNQPDFKKPTTHSNPIGNSETNLSNSNNHVLLFLSETIQAEPAYLKQTNQVSTTQPCTELDSNSTPLIAYQTTFPSQFNTPSNTNQSDTTPETTITTFPNQSSTNQLTSATQQPNNFPTPFNASQPFSNQISSNEIVSSIYSTPLTSYQTTFPNQFSPNQSSTCATQQPNFDQTFSSQSIFPNQSSTTLDKPINSPRLSSLDLYMEVGKLVNALNQQRCPQFDRSIHFSPTAFDQAINARSLLNFEKYYDPELKENIIVVLKTPIIEADKQENNNNNNKQKNVGEYDDYCRHYMSCREALNLLNINNALRGSSSILKFYGVLGKVGKQNIVTEFLSGNTLEHLILNHGNDESRSLSIEINVYTIASTLISGIARLHEIDIVHADISCSNIMFRTPTSLECVLIDFELSDSISNPLLLPQFAKYHPIYAPSSDITTTDKFDIYSYGVVLLSLINQKLFSTRAEMKNHVKRDHFFSKLIFRCMNDDADLRPSAKEIETDILPQIKAVYFYGEIEKLEHAIQLIRFEEQGPILFPKTVHIQAIPSGVRILSIIGKARKGKSTILNILGSSGHVSKHNKIFSVSDSFDTTETIGIFGFPHGPFLLLDTEGIDLGSTAKNLKMAAIVCSISSLVVYNLKSEIPTHPNLMYLENITKTMTQLKEKSNFNVSTELLFLIRDSSRIYGKVVDGQPPISLEKACEKWMQESNDLSDTPNLIKRQINLCFKKLHFIDVSIPEKSQTADILWSHSDNKPFWEEMEEVKNKILNLTQPALLGGYLPMDGNDVYNILQQAVSSIDVVDFNQIAPDILKRKIDNARDSILSEIVVSEDWVKVYLGEKEVIHITDPEYNSILEKFYSFYEEKFHSFLEISNSEKNVLDWYSTFSVFQDSKKILKSKCDKELTNRQLLDIKKYYEDEKARLDLQQNNAEINEARVIQKYQLDLENARMKYNAEREQHRIVTRSHQPNATKTVKEYGFFGPRRWSCCMGNDADTCTIQVTYPSNYPPWIDSMFKY